MWTRGQIKQRGKTSFKRNYWKCVLVSLIMLLLFGGATSTSGAGDSTDDIMAEFQNLAMIDTAEWGLVLVAVLGVVDYILANEPELSPKECLRRSKDMMKGNKWKAFVLDVSFWGWTILSSITCGILGVFFVNPYINATEAEWYLVLRNNNHK